MYCELQRMNKEVALELRNTVTTYAIAIAAAAT
jgi:hypothetical protein